MIHVTEVQSVPELSAIRTEWSDLWERSANATPFSSPEWLLPWTRHLFGGGEIWSLAAWANDRLVGFAPMFIHGIGHKQASFLGSGVTDYLDFLADAECARESVHAMWLRLRQSARWDSCEFVEIPPGSPILDEAPDATRSRSSVCPVVSLPSCMEALEASLSGKFRHHLRNALNRVREVGGSFEIAEPGTNAEYVEALFRLHSERWAGRGEPGMLATADVQEFFREMTHEFQSRGWLRMIGLRCGATLHAVVCIFCARRRWMYYLGGFDRDLARFSPGNLLIRFAMEQAIHEGACEFDFLRNGEAYKYRWRARDRINTRFLLRAGKFSL